MRYEVYCRVDSSLKELANYIKTFSFVAGGQERFRLNYCSRMNFTEPCELLDAAGESVMKLRPVARVGNSKIQFAVHDREVGALAGKKLIDAEGRVLARVADRAGLGKAVLRNALGGEPDSYSFLSPQGDRLGEMSDVKPRRLLPWPLSIVEALVRLFLPRKMMPQYTVDIHSDDVDEKCLLAVSAILDVNRRSAANAV